MSTPTGGGQFATDTATMATAADRVTTVAEQVETELRNLDGRIQPIVSTWFGQGSYAYQSLHTRWTEDARKLRTVLEEIAVALRQNGVRYQTHDDAVVAAMTRVQTGA